MTAAGTAIRIGDHVEALNGTMVLGWELAKIVEVLGALTGWIKLRFKRGVGRAVPTAAAAKLPRQDTATLMDELLLHRQETADGGVETPQTRVSGEELGQFHPPIFAACIALDSAFGPVMSAELVGVTLCRSILLKKHF